jgi:hypothetical protein
VKEDQWYLVRSARGEVDVVILVVGEGRGLQMGGRGRTGRAGIIRVIRQAFGAFSSLTRPLPWWAVL